MSIVFAVLALLLSGFSLGMITANIIYTYPASRSKSGEERKNGKDGANDGGNH